MARKTRPAPAKPPESVQVWHAHIGRDRKGGLHYLGTQAQGSPQYGSGLEEIAVVDIGRSFRLHVPSSPGHGTYGLLIDGMTGINAGAWSASQVLAAARFGMFGFRIMDPSESSDRSHAAPVELSNSQP